MVRAAILRDRFVLTLAAAALLVVGFTALYWPVSLTEYDQWGFQISCGSSFVADYSQAEATDPSRVDGGDPVSACRSAVWWRRAWATTLVIGGAAALIALLLNGFRQSPVEHGQDRIVRRR